MGLDSTFARAHAISPAFGVRELVLVHSLRSPSGSRAGARRHSCISTSGGRASMRKLLGAFFFTFFFIAVPEELFFRGWLQNLLERRMGRYPALMLTAALFGLSHFNKRAVHFNWRYVLLAALAGIFYGRAWRQERRVGASAITHASVDTIWSLWLR